MANLKQRIQAALKGFRFPQEAGSTGGYDGFGNVNFTLKDDLSALIAAVDPLGNSIVMLCLDWITSVWPEAPMRMYREDTNGKRVIQPKRSGNLAIRNFQECIARPNEDYGDEVLWAGTITSLKFDGNAYWYKLRNLLDGVIGYIWIPWFLIEPVYPRDGSKYIDYYAYKPGFGKPIRIDPKDIVHFRTGVDPKNTRKGLAPLKAGFLEIFSDNEWGQFSAAFATNYGAIGLAVFPDPALFKDLEYTGPGENERKAIKERIDAQTTNGKQGSTLVHSLPLRIEKFGADLSKLMTREQRKTAEERIPALFGLSAGLVKVGAGLDRNTMANAEEEEQQGYRRGVSPLHRSIASALDQQALPDFTNDTSYVVGFDTSEVRALQEDQNKLAERMALLFEGDVIKRKVALATLGYEIDEVEDNVYRSKWLSTFQQVSPITIAPTGLKKAK